MNFSKGLYAIFCGLGVAWLGSVYKMEQGDGGVLADMLYNAFFAVGETNPRAPTAAVTVLTPVLST